MYSSIFTKLDAEALKRDDHKCVNCSKETGLEEHHIIPELELITNLITLCHSCHKKEHNMAGCFKKGFDEKRKIFTDKEMEEMRSKKAPGKLSRTIFTPNRYYHTGKKEWVIK